MPFLGRKVSRDRWSPSHGVSPDEIPAAAVTLDLKTADNTLSFWRSGEAEGARQLAALAMAARGNRADPIQTVAIDESALSDDAAVETRPANADCLAQHVRDAHVEAHSLDADRLVSVAGRIARVIRANEVVILTKAEVVKLLKQGIEHGDIKEKYLHPDLKAEISGSKV